MCLLQWRRRNTEAAAKTLANLMKHHTGLEIGLSTEGRILFKIPDRGTYTYRRGGWIIKYAGQWLDGVGGFSFGTLKRGWRLLKKDPSFASTDELDEELRGQTWLYKKTKTRNGQQD